MTHRAIPTGVSRAVLFLGTGVRHRLQPRRRRQGHVRLGGRRRLGEDVRPAPPGAQHHHLRGPPAPPSAAALLEQAGPQLSRYHGHGRYGGKAAAALPEMLVVIF